MDVDSKNIINKNKKNTNTYFNNFINICTLNTKCYLYIEKIFIKKDIGKNNGRISLGVVGYKTINHDLSISTMNSIPKDFKITIETNGNVENTHDILKWTTDNLIKRFIRILDCIKDENNNEIYFTYEYNVYKLYISNESHTIGKLLEKYIYELDKSINHVAMREIQPGKREVVIDIKHIDAKKITVMAIEAIINDFRAFAAFFTATRASRIRAKH